MQAKGFAPLFVTAMVYPGQETDLSAELTPIDRQPNRIGRWTAWWGIGVAVGGAVAVGFGASAGGIAAPPAH
jgi:hypothetical protein